MSASNAAIPFEMQSDPQTSRGCGAACLSMVYRSFGKEIPQAEIWAAVAKENRFGSLASTTHLMTKDALSRGFSAVAIQARHPLHALRICRESGIRAILNHRLNHDSPAGHFTVLVDIDDRNVELHDPFLGPSQRLSHAELLELWQPGFSDSEIRGNMLIGVAAGQPVMPACELCGTPMLPAVECPQCKKPVLLQPAALLACMSSACIARIWNYVCCAFCDCTWTFSVQPVEAPRSEPGSVGPSVATGGSPTPTSEQAPLTLDKVFAALDTFCSHILSLPAAASHPDIKKQLDLIAASKEKLKVAEAEGLAHREAHRQQLAKLQELAKAREEAHRKKMEEINRPSPPLDGNALGRALLKNLGFKD